MVAEAAGEIGDPQVRNRGTIGGSLAHADPAADFPAVMVALDAEIHLKGPNGWRAVKAGDFFQDLFTVDMADDELIVGVQFQPVQAAAYAKLHQRASHYAIVGVCVALDVSAGMIRSARVSVTGASTHAQRMTNVEQALAGKPLNQATIDAAASVAGEELTDINADLHASEAYRRAMVKVFTRRALEKAAARAQRRREQLSRRARPAGGPVVRRRSADSVDEHAAVDWEGDAGDVPGFIRHEKSAA